MINGSKNKGKVIYDVIIVFDAFKINPKLIMFWQQINNSYKNLEDISENKSVALIRL